MIIRQLQQRIPPRAEHLREFYNRCRILADKPYKIGQIMRGRANGDLRHWIDEHPPEGFSRSAQSFIEILGNRLTLLARVDTKSFEADRPVGEYICAALMYT
ncbi:hypothetical protein JG687_00015960 [Phytophthora cactorum]|uniref:Uncharacterized protein n=1 Tax=Phytophthora cactorum TaxID=29920 RepID=A0A8T1TRX3_9STRA|nr:hypothetical protein JG687_00015960 [Phytophthora cactorum]